MTKLVLAALVAATAVLSAPAFAEADKVHEEVPENKTTEEVPAAPAALTEEGVAK